MSRDKLEEITDAIYFYGKDLTCDKKLVDYIDDLESLIKSQREEAVREFVARVKPLLNTVTDQETIQTMLDQPDETTSDKWRTQGYVEGGTNERN